MYAKETLDKLDEVVDYMTVVIENGLRQAKQEGFTHAVVKLSFIQDGATKEGAIVRPHVDIYKAEDEEECWRLFKDRESEYSRFNSQVWDIQGDEFVHLEYPNKR